MSVGILLLVDESAAMDTAAATGGAGAPVNMSGPAKSKAESVATAVNSLLARLAQMGGAEVALVGYRSTREGQTEVGSRWGGTLSGHDIVSAAELGAAPLMVEQRLRRVRNEAGLTEELPVQFPIWYQPTLGDKAPRIAAFDYCRGLLENWRPADGSHGQVLVFHITSGAAGDGNPSKAVKQLQELSVNGMPPLVMHVHLGSTTSTLPALFPASRAYLPAGPQRDLFDQSSVLPPHLIEALKGSGVAVSGQARGMVYNAKMIDVSRALNLIATHVQKSLAGQASVAAVPTPTAKPAAAGPKLGPAIIKPPPGPPRPPAAKPVAVKPPSAVAPPAAPVLARPPAPPSSPPIAAPISAPPTPAAPIQTAPAPVVPAPLAPAPVAPPVPVIPDPLPLVEPPVDIGGGDDLLLVDTGAPTTTGGEMVGVVSSIPSISESAPGCLVFVLDRSVNDPFAADLGNVCARLQTQLSDMIAEVAKAGRGAIDVAVVTYGDAGEGDVDVRTTLEGGLSGRSFARDSELLSGAIRVDEFEDQVSDGVGGLISIPRKRPVLVEVDPTGPARMQPAFSAVAALLRQWCASHSEASLSPVVVHLTRGMADADDVRSAVAELSSVTTFGGAAVVVYHAVTTEAPHPAAVYPDVDTGLETDSLRALWESASPLLFGDALSSEKPTIRAGARGLVVNGKFFLLTDPFKRALSGNG